MRGSGEAPAATASRSAAAPAQKTAKPARVSPCEWPRTTRFPSTLTVSTAQPVTTSASRSRSPAASERATAAKSTMPVEGESSAATPRACGSTALSSSAFRRRSPLTPFSRPRRSSSSSRPSSPS